MKLIETSKMVGRTEWPSTTFIGPGMGAERPSPRRDVQEILADCDAKIRYIEMQLSHRSEANG
jgi:hypothetical protein